LWQVFKCLGGYRMQSYPYRDVFLAVEKQLVEVGSRNLNEAEIQACSFAIHHSPAVLCPNLLAYS
jgi:hypothetical protein